MTRMTRISAIIMPIIRISACVSALHEQAASGAVAEIPSDATISVIPNTSIKIVDLGTDITREVKANAEDYQVIFAAS
jgi:hypothetical protein